jgi:hypothetical protein
VRFVQPVVLMRKPDRRRPLGVIRSTPDQVLLLLVSLFPACLVDVNNGIAYSYPAPSNWTQNGSDSNGTWQCVATTGFGSVTAYALCCS